MTQQVFVHGLGQTEAAWQAMLQEFPKEAMANKSCPQLLSYLQQSCTYQALYQGFAKECLQYEQPLQICGLSLGAVLALQFAAEYPAYVQSLILLAPQYKMPKRLLQLQNMVFRCLPQKAFAEMGLTKKQVLQMTQSMQTLDFTAQLHNICCPVLIGCGQKDRANRKAAQTLVQSLPNARLHTFAGAGHDLNVQCPKALAQEVKQFFAEPLS